MRHAQAHTASVLLEQRMRTGLAALLNARPDMAVVGEAADGVDLLTLAEALQPDVILLDLTMPRLGGLDVLPLLRQRLPHARVLILTMHHDEGYLRQLNLRSRAALGRFALANGLME